MADDLSVWDKFWYKDKFANIGVANLRLANIFSLISICTSIVNSVVSFFMYLYTAIPPVVDRLADGFIKCSNFIISINEPVESAYDQIGSVVSDIETNSVSVDGGSNLWEMVKYVIDIDALADSLNFVVSIGWFWIFLVVVVLVVATGFLVAGSLIYVTRRFIVFVSVGLVDYG